MKLIRLKITDPKGFRCLQAGFEHCFRSEWDLQEEQGFAPFVCAGPNGSGKSNLLEALAAIFYHMECMYLENLPDSFVYEEESNTKGFQGAVSMPDGFELAYRFNRIDDNFYTSAVAGVAQAGSAFAGATDLLDRGREFEIHISKEPEKSPVFTQIDLETGEQEKLVARQEIKKILPEYVLGYSSGENEILSLPFFKMRFIQLDEYLQALKQQLPYSGRPESRLVYLDSGFSQAILLCNLLFHEADALDPLRKDVKIEELKEFRIIIRRSIEVDESQIQAFGSQDEHNQESTEAIVENHPALSVIEDEPSARRYRVDLVQLLNDSDNINKSSKIIPRLTRCATCWYLDEATDTQYLDYRVDEATRRAFSENFDFEVNRSPISLFQALQVLLTLNLFSASDDLKKDLYQSNSLYASETVPVLASDERIMRFKNFWVTKTDVADPVLLKSFSDGEHQLLHTLGLCLLFKGTQSLFLLDEPETHFNPDWRANFVSRLHQSFNDSDRQDRHERRDMLITTHTPFLISDSRPEKVLVFNKTGGEVSVRHPDYNTLGASINKITMTTFDKRETIGGQAQMTLDGLRLRFEKGEDKEQLIAEINQKLGDSVEKMLLIKTILDSMEA